MQLDPLVKPRSVAIVGATDRPSPARSVIESLGALGFPGAIYPVNPKYQTVANHVCYPSLTDLPEAPDVVVFSIRNPLIPEQMRLAARRGARAAVIYDSGFAELGEDGARLQAEIAGLCREAGMAVCGPNCMGIINPPARVTTYKQTVMEPAGLAGNVGFISQSGSVCIAMLSDLRRFGISLSVSAGNEAVTRTVDYIEYLIDDPNTKVIGTFTETVREPERYVAALDRAANAGKPVVVLKVGKTERTQRAITSHTGGLAGESRVFSELLRAHRAIEVNDLDEMTEVLAVCQGARWPRGRGISVITGSGGLAELILDNATVLGLDLPPLSPAERKDAESVIGRITGDGNPFDAWGNGNYAVNLPHAMSVVDKSERIASVVYCSDTSNDPLLGHPGRVLENVTMLAKAASQSSKPYYLLSTRSGVMNRQQVDAMRQEGLVVIGGTRQGLAALDRVGRYMAGQPPVRAPAVKPQSGLAELIAAKPGRPTINEFELQAVAVGVRRAGDAGAPGRDPRRGDGGRPRARFPGGAQGSVRRDRAQVRPRPGGGQSAQRGRSGSRLRAAQRAHRPAGKAAVRSGLPGAGVRCRRRRGVRRHFARPRLRPDDRVRDGRHRDRSHARLRAAHVAAARGRRRGDDCRDPWRGAARARSAAGRRPTSRALRPASTRWRILPSTTPTSWPRSISTRSRRAPRAAAAWWSMR